MIMDAKTFLGQKLDVEPAPSLEELDHWCDEWVSSHPTARRWVDLNREWNLAVDMMVDEERLTFQ